MVHAHVPKGEHSHADTAFTTWLDLAQSIQQAQAVRDALTNARPQLEAEFEQWFTVQESDLRALDQ